MSEPQIGPAPVPSVPDPDPRPDQPFAAGAGIGGEAPSPMVGEEAPEAAAEHAPDLAGQEDPDGEDEEDEEEFATASDVLARLSSLGLTGAEIGVRDVRVDGQNATGHGATAIGSINNITVSDTESTIWCQVLSAAAVRDMDGGYAPAPTDDRLDLLLKRKHLVCLDGRPGTGRYTAACLALARRHAGDRVAVLSAGQLGELIRRDRLLRGGFGYLLRLDPGQLPVDGFTRIGLAARMETLGSSLILIGDFARQSQDLAGELVEHQAAEASEVFRRQLAHRLRGRCLAGCPGCDGGCRSDYISRECLTQSTLRAYLAGSPRPAEVVRLVDAIAQSIPRGTALAQLLGRQLPEQLRQRAQEILEPAGSDATLTELGGADYLRAFRLSCAVLAGQPLAEIGAAAERLLGGPGSEEPGMGSTLRQPDLELLLGPPLRQATVLENPDLRPGARSLRFRPESAQLPANMLDVAWREWAVPERLLNWFADLVRTAAPGSRQAAAGAIGWAAGRDAGAAIGLIRELAGERRPGVRQAAGIALVATALQPQLQRRIRIELDNWAKDGSAYQRDTVARAYALGLGWLWPEAAIDQLGKVARARLQRRNNSVVRALVEIYQAGSADLVVPALVRWAGSADREVRLHAARALRVLAERWAEPPQAHWPELLELVRSGTLRMSDVGALWAVALSLPETAYRSWRTLGYWLNRADGRPEVADSCLELLRLTITDRPLRRRLDHQVRHVWRPIMPRNELLFRVSRLTIEG
ncbi:ATP-binding protein [Plantactinospora endophytica]|uniref:HEAT repeat domain-containing protein n=1 Tax=Plantactinospora endophytica TaxID=673535 RepID=A0ABQ4EDR8_9ACTN|nr:hypothetical protein [Plantactinospora endophytica]GIG92401.1 hypothetical protein Pen02_73370 [Plantactinospora endophytica]